VSRDFARHLRRNSSDAERLLWSRLRDHRFSGFKFRRQEPIGPYIADFLCYPKRLIIELDGGQHAARVTEDEERTRWLNEQGFQVMRFWNYLLFEDLDSVLETIWLALFDPTPPHPDPPPPGGREPE
jgi:very-short-patch-repair endonuclease